jgi:NADPH-dependent glutamate synthase beta subunit-like oxidoreductase
VTPPPADLTPLPDLVGEQALAGPTRTRRPVYVDLLAPCNAACPAGEDVQGWLARIRGGDEEGAWRLLVRDNPFPAVHGRICYHPCEDDCNRRQLDAAVSMHAVERFLGDLAIERGWRFDAPRVSTGKRVLVVGSGPCGLSAAYQLVRLGHGVEIHDVGAEPGGMMRYGIPAYRLPRHVLDAEIRRVEALGVRIVSRHRVEDLTAERRAGGFDAVFTAVGAHLPKHVDIPARDAGRIVDALDLLERVAAGERPVLGRRVAVYGGGNTAMDAARVARRLGAQDAVIVYRRTRAQMPAHEEELEEAEREGVRVSWLRTIGAFDAPQLRVEVMELDAEGFPRPTGRFETLDADTVILALGQDADTGFLRRVAGIDVEADGTVQVSPGFETGAPGVFAGGDMVPGDRTVTAGVGHGKRAARQIDAWLRGVSVPAALQHRLAGFDDLHLWYFGDAARRSSPEIPAARRIEGFGEVVGDLSPGEAASEAARCLSCGNCFECDGCLGACPEDAVVKLGPGLRYRFDDERCTGCGDCFDQCPVHAIEMVGEQP